MPDTEFDVEADLACESPLGDLNPTPHFPSRSQPKLGVKVQTFPRLSLKRKGLVYRHMVPQVRFRPGLMTMWRELRWRLTHTLHIKTYRQKRLTDYVALLRSTTGFALIKALSLSVGCVTQQSMLLSSVDCSRAGLWQGALQGL